MIKHKLARKIRKTINFRLVFTGMSMGLCDLIPGVSSGTVAFLYGIYDELLYAINTITSQTLRLFLKLRFRQAWRSIPFKFILPLMIGMVVSVFAMSDVVGYLLETQPVFTWSLFFGFVLGSVFMVKGRVKSWGKRQILILLAGFVSVFLLVGMPALQMESSPVVVFVSGIIGSIAMILPGISGSLILVLIGQYENIINSISNRDFVTLAIFACGIVVGLSLFARLLGWLLRNHHNSVMVVLIGVILGSLRAVWPWQNYDFNPNSIAGYVSVLVSIVLMAVGFFVVVALEKIGIATEHNSDIDMKNKN